MISNNDNLLLLVISLYSHFHFNSNINSNMVLGSLTSSLASLLVVLPLIGVCNFRHHSNLLGTFLSHKRLVIDLCNSTNINSKNIFLLCLLRLDMLLKPISNDAIHSRCHRIGCWCCHHWLHAMHHSSHQCSHQLTMSAIFSHLPSPTTALCCDWDLFYSFHSTSSMVLCTSNSIQPSHLFLKSYISNSRFL